MTARNRIIRARFWCFCCWLGCIAVTRALPTPDDLWPTNLADYDRASTDGSRHENVQGRLDARAFWLSEQNESDTRVLQELVATVPLTSHPSSSRISDGYIEPAASLHSNDFAATALGEEPGKAQHSSGTSLAASQHAAAWQQRLAFVWHLGKAGAVTGTSQALHLLKVGYHAARRALPWLQAAYRGATHLAAWTTRQLYTQGAALCRIIYQLTHPTRIVADPDIGVGRASMAQVESGSQDSPSAAAEQQEAVELDADMEHTSCCAGTELQGQNGEVAEGEEQQESRVAAADLLKLNTADGTLADSHSAPSIDLAPELNPTHDLDPAPEQRAVDDLGSPLAPLHIHATPAHDIIPSAVTPAPPHAMNPADPTPEAPHQPSQLGWPFTPLLDTPNMCYLNTSLDRTQSWVDLVSSLGTLDASSLPAAIIDTTCAASTSSPTTERMSNKLDLHHLLAQLRSFTQTLTRTLSDLQQWWARTWQQLSQPGPAQAWSQWQLPLACLASGCAAACAMWVVMAHAMDRQLRAHTRALSCQLLQHAQELEAGRFQHSSWQAQFQEQAEQASACADAAASVALAMLSQQHSQAVKRLLAAQASSMAAAKAAHAKQLGEAIMRKHASKAALRRLAAQTAASTKAALTVQAGLRAGLLSVARQLVSTRAQLEHMHSQVAAVKTWVAQQQQDRQAQAAAAAATAAAAQAQLLQEQNQQLVGLQQAHALELAACREGAAQQLSRCRQEAKAAAHTAARRHAKLTSAWLVLREQHKVLITHLENKAVMQVHQHQRNVERLEASLAEQHCATMALQQELSRARADVASKEDMLAELNVYLDENMVQIGQLQAALRGKDQQIAQKVELMEQLQGTLQGVEEKVAASEELGRELSRQLESAKELDAVRQADITSLQEQVAVMEPELAKLPVYEARLLEATHLLESFMARQTQAEQALAGLQEQLGGKTKDIEALTSQLAAAATAAAARERELQALVDAKERELKKQAEAKDKEVRMRLGDIALLKAEAAQLEMELKGLRKPRTPLPAASNVLQALSTNTPGAFSSMR
ncbi:hypothetical protein V8C86DRAFT_2495110 [Haematococcus lacustris]